MIWKPNVTVAAVIERDGRFLLVEEETTDGVRFNQPAGHLDEGESLLEAVARETLEETAHRFVPRFLVGIYQWRRPAGDLTYLRFAFGGEVTGHEAGQALDEGILRALWMSPDELAQRRERHRSPLVAQCIADYLAGRRYPLDLITHYA
jgi:8-oxo-dGTP pyrophosphatase MutT (NUDIX family)